MARYVKRRPAARREVAWWDAESPMLPSLEVSDHEASFTGLFDADGDEIWREPRPIGFGRTKEW